jgi:hypothetical protein
MALPLAPSETPAQEDVAMLSFMVSAAYQGVDIAARYPTFYNKLQRNQMLREHFLDALDLMEHSKAGTLAPLPGTPRRDLSFLYKTKPKPTIAQNSGQGWRITWRETWRRYSIFCPDRKWLIGEKMIGTKTVGFLSFGIRSR